MKTEFLTLGRTPLADQFPVTKHDALTQELYPLGLTVDEHWQVELTHVVPDERLFGSDYAFFTGTSPTLITYFEAYAGWVKRRFPDQVQRGVCEIACNDGTLLRHFKDTRHLGIDPALPAVTQAHENGLTVLTRRFTADLAREFGEPFGVVIANNVAAHVTDLADFMTGIAHLIRDGGVGLVEFQYVGDLLGDCLWPLVYHEHHRFLSLTSFTHAANAAGLWVKDLEWTTTQGGSLRVMVTRVEPPRGPETWSESRVGRVLLEQELWLRRLDIYASFQGRVDRQVNRLRDAMDRFDTVALYGAPAKATTLIHHAVLTGELEYAVDLTPGKIGRFLPGTTVPVISPGQERDTWLSPAAYLVAVPNYLPAILRREHRYLADGGHLILPDGTVI